MGTSPHWKTQRGDRIIAIWMGKKTFARWKNPLCQSWRSENNLYWSEISICQRVPKQEGPRRFQTKIWCKQQCFTNTSWTGTVYTLAQYSLRALYHTVYLKKVPDPLLFCGICRGHLKVQMNCKWLPWSSRIYLVSFRTFWGPRFYKLLINQVLFGYTV